VIQNVGTAPDSGPLISHILNQRADQFQGVVPGWKDSAVVISYPQPSLKKSNSSRKFIQKVAATTAGALIVSRAGLSLDKADNMEKPELKHIKPLGFPWETRDPFLFCVHHEDFYPNGNDDLGPDASLEGRQIGQDFMIKDGWRMYHGSKVPGFPGHPHRGFETITVVRKGMVDHFDSLGASGRYGDGDVQWMTAGKGMQHAEMFPLIHEKKDNPLDLFQIWLNLPGKRKFVEPAYKMLWGENMPSYTHTDANGKKTLLEVIAGTLDGHTALPPPPDSWARDPSNEVAIWNIEMDAGAEWTVPPALMGINRTIYFFKGERLKIAGQTLNNLHSAEMSVHNPITIESGSEKSHILILQGRPIGEPVVQHGPFVMNTRAEIQQAYQDYQDTKFGGWPWPVNDPVHPRAKGRFAKYADGTEEIKG